MYGTCLDYFGKHYPCTCLDCESDGGHIHHLHLSPGPGEDGAQGGDLHGSGHRKVT
jgi:hypothetical protein